jgi:putative chitinase
MLLVKLVLRREQAWPGSLAYILTTAFHESAKTMAAISEFSQGTKYDNSHKMKMGKGPKGRIFCTHPD